MSEFIVDTSYSGYVYVGHAVGNVLKDDGEKQPYYNMYVISPVSSYTSVDYAAVGMKAEKKKCVTPDVFTGLTPGDKVKLFFDDKQRVIMAEID